MKTTRILLVAGDRIMLTLMSFILSKRGCQVDSVTNGIKAVRELGEGRAGYDAIVTCDDLPVMTGSDLCREAKKISKGIKVIGVKDEENGQAVKPGSGHFDQREKSSGKETGDIPVSSGYDYLISGELKVQKINDALDFVLKQ